MTDTRTLPDWPAMMSLELAAAYLSVGEELFRGLAARRGVRPVDLGARRVLWRKRDLDAMVEQLPELDTYRAEAGSPRAAATPATIGVIDPTEAALAHVRRSSRRRRP